MRKKWRIYENRERKEEGKKWNPGVLILSYENFKVLEFSILPSIDEKDRKRSVFQKLEERFLDIKELSFLYFELLSQDKEEEKIFCSYLKEEVEGKNIPSYIEFVIPAHLLGKCLSSKEHYFIIEYGRKDILFFAYTKGKIEFFQKIENAKSIGSFESILQKNILKERERKQNILLIGEYTQEDFLYWEEKFPILSIQNLKINKIPKEIDIFHHERFKRGGGKYYKNVSSAWMSFLLIGTIFLGFYFQYQLEENKITLAELEEENKLLEVDTRKLEEDITDLQNEKEEEEKIIIEKKKIVEDLKKIYFLASALEIVALEYLETGIFKLQFLSVSTREYTNFIRKILLANFQFVNHDYIERKQGEYKVEIEIKKGEL